MHETFRARLGVIVLASGNPGASLRDAYLATGTGCTYRTNSAPAILLNQNTLLKAARPYRPADGTALSFCRAPTGTISNLAAPTSPVFSRKYASLLRHGSQVLSSLLCASAFSASLR